MEYKVGDKVKVIHTDYPHTIPIGSVKEVLWANSAGLDLEGSNGTRLTFFNREVEPYKEEVMNDKIEVGDTVEYTLSYMNKEQRVVESIVGETLYFTNGKKNNIKDLKLVSKAKQNMKEVIGYNIKPEFKGKEADFAKIFKTTANYTSQNPQMWMPHDSFVVPHAKDLGVLDLWFEPVYKSSEVVVKLSKNRTVTITSKILGTVTLTDSSKMGITSDTVNKTVEALKSLPTISGYKPKFREFELGCQTFTVDDLIAVDKAFKDYQ